MLLPSLCKHRGVVYHGTRVAQDRPQYHVPWLAVMTRPCEYNSNTFDAVYIDQLAHLPPRGTPVNLQQPPGRKATSCQRLSA